MEGRETRLGKGEKMNGTDPAYPTDKTYEYNDPQAGDYTRYEVPKYVGLTKREYFIGKIAEGICSSAVAWPVEKEKFAKVAIDLADALIAELSK